MIDFTNCPIDLSANYGGSEKKRGVIYNGRRYMLKMADRIPQAKRNNFNESYSNNVFSEYIGCHVSESIGLDVQQTMLGTISLQSSKGQLLTYPVVACENFIPDGFSLIEFKHIENALLLNKPSKTPRLTDICELMKIENIYFKDGFGEQALKRYWDTFILDALLGNFDRHSNNWGYLLNKKTQKLSLAPIYDCGSCLYPQLADDALPHILNNKEEIQMRVNKFPLAALEVDEKKVSYKDYILSFANKDCTDALLRIYPKIDIIKINKIIETTPTISAIRQIFYKTMLKERYTQILQIPYECLLEHDCEVHSEKELEL